MDFDPSDLALLPWERDPQGRSPAHEGAGGFPSVFDLPRLESAGLGAMDSLTLEKAAQIVAYAEGLDPHDCGRSPTANLLHDERFSDCLFGGGGEAGDEARDFEMPFSFSTSETQSADNDFPLMYLPKGVPSGEDFSSMDTPAVGLDGLLKGAAGTAAQTPGRAEAPKQTLEQKAAAVVVAIDRALLAEDAKAHARTELQVCADKFLAKRRQISEQLVAAAGAAAAANPQGLKSVSPSALLESFDASCGAALDSAKARVESLAQPIQREPSKQTDLLKKWLYDHFDNPFPSDQEKLDLAELVGCSRRQVQNWFINARVRYWRPMVWRLAARIEGSEGTLAGERSAPPQIKVGTTSREGDGGAIGQSGSESADDMRD
jgi:hypothetical protein